MKKFLLAALVGPAVAWSLSSAGEILPFEDVRTGMKGTGRTVFAGTEVQEFEVEILGKLSNIGPKQNLILGRCSGGPLAETGVLSGMSGSPVFVDGRLIGAVAYSWGFATDAIAGITPIEEMLAVAEQGEESQASPAAGGISPDDLVRLASPDRIPGFLSARMAALAPGGVAGRPFRLPMAIAGVGPEGLARMAPDLLDAGFLPVQGSAPGTSADPAPPIEAGSAVGLKLARGDIDISVSGTVTRVDGDGLLAFGHPLFGLGQVDLPLTGARVEALLPSLNQSMRIASPLAEVGALREDRAAGVYGRLGSTARMIPIRLQLDSSAAPPRSYSFDVADDPLLGPLLLYSSLNGVLANAERLLGSITVGVAPGSVIKLEGREDVDVSNLFAGPTASFQATGTSAFILYLLMNNDWSPPRVEGVNLILEYEPQPRTGRIRRVSLDRYRVRAGEHLTVTVVLTPFRGPDLVLSREIEVPPETAPGRLNLTVGGALDVSRSEGTGENVFPRDLDQLIWLINNLRKNDRVYVVASRDDSGVLLGGARLPNLPPSVTSILARPRSLGNYAVVRQRGILEEELPTPFAVSGLTGIQLEVEAP
jgi:hypothetical protein